MNFVGKYYLAQDSSSLEQEDMGDISRDISPIGDQFDLLGQN